MGLRRIAVALCTSCDLRILAESSFQRRDRLVCAAGTPEASRNLVHSNVRFGGDSGHAKHLAGVANLSPGGFEIGSVLGSAVLRRNSDEC
jgi:hypothetical protein